MGLYRSAGNAEPWHLIRKVFLLLLVVTALALGLVYLLQWGRPAPPLSRADEGGAGCYVADRIPASAKRSPDPSPTIDGRGDLAEPGGR